MNDSEAWRRECECKEWMRRTNRDPAKIKALLLRIEAKRGKDAAEVLRQDMREAYLAANRGAGERKRAG